MPLHDYKCFKCENFFEAWQSNFQPETITCPECGCTEVQKQMSLYGGYKIKGTNGGSTTPKGSGSFKRS